MLHRVEIDRTYGPETLAVVGAAFDRVWQAALKRMKFMNGNDGAKRALALTVLRLLTMGSAIPNGSPRLPCAIGQTPTIGWLAIVRRWFVTHKGGGDVGSQSHGDYRQLECELRGCRREGHRSRGQDALERRGRVGQGAEGHR
jgi:hypothetical protein